jgi:lipopolysaccharide/colanic/teichoic acid biosynthesis glycosyltransferase
VNWEQLCHELPVLPVVESRLKRAFDVSFALVVMILTFPFFLLLVVLVKLDSRGPAVFSQERAGLRGEPFRMHKLRTMEWGVSDHVHREYAFQLIAENRPYVSGQKETLYKVNDDSRVTCLGRFLRRTSLDELPQFWNVLKGDMSVVGPRPPLVYELDVYEPRHVQRLAGRPGVTGLWQVSGRSRLSFERMVDLDVEYLWNWSFWGDLKLIARTIPEVMRSRQSL